MFSLIFLLFLFAPLLFLPMMFSGPRQVHQVQPSRRQVAQQQQLSFDDAYADAKRWTDRLGSQVLNLPGSDSPNPDFTNKVREEALKRGLILLTCGVYGNVVRFLAPLTIPDAVFEEALDILDESLLAARG